MAASCASFSRDETVVEKDEFGRKTKYEVDWSCSSAPSADCAVAHLSFDVTARTPYGQILSYSYVMTCANTNEETTGTVTKVTYAANGNAYRVEYDVASKSCVLTQ